MKKRISLLECGSAWSQVARPQRLELSHSGGAGGAVGAGGRPDTFVTGPAAIRHLDIINSHEGMTRDLSPLFQCLITKSVCCLHRGQDFNPHRGYRFVIVQVGYFVRYDDTKAFIVYVCYLSPLPSTVPGSQVAFSGHTSFRLLGILLNQAAHTYTICICVNRFTINIISIGR